MLSELEGNIGYRFRDKSLLERALTHSSYANEKWKNSLTSNERLEFLGDSILGFLVAEQLYRQYPDHPEGDLTRMRAELVCETNLARAAERLGLGEYLLLGRGEEQGGGRSRSSINADAVESVIAASYLDGGFPAARGIVQRLILAGAPGDRGGSADFKTALQELVQRKKNQCLTYTLLEESGPDHDKTFRVEVSLNGETVGAGSGTSKKRAEQAAAEAAIDRLFPGGR